MLLSVRGKAYAGKGPLYDLPYFNIFFCMATRTASDNV